MWCIPDKPSAEFVYHMEDVLEVYHRPYDPKRPVVCVDETFKQLIGETREPLPMRPGTVERFDYVYTRNGVASLVLACDPLAGWRHLAVTDHRCHRDWALFIRALLEGRYRDAEKLVLVMELPQGLGLVHPCAAGGALSGRGEAGAGDGPTQHPLPGQPL
jgi:DDE superfamily endonuclease